MFIAQRRAATLFLMQVRARTRHLSLQLSALASGRVEEDGADH